MKTWLSALCLALLWAGAVCAESNNVDIELKSGDIVNAEIVRVSEQGIEIRLSGVPMQMAWDLLRAERFIDERKSLFEDDDLAGWQSYARWCIAYAVDSELGRANENIVRLGGSAVTSANQSRTTHEPAPTDRAHPKATPVSFAFADDGELEAAVREALRTFGIDESATHAELTLELRDYKLEKTDEKKFFDASIEVTYAATCVCVLLDRQGNVKFTSEILNSGNHDSAGKDADNVAKKNARDTLANLIAQFVSVKVQTE